jgi:predicted ArsR family transcriptional regulator
MLRGATTTHLAGPAAPGVRGGAWCGPFPDAAAVAFTLVAMDALPADRDLAAIALLRDPVRRALYGHVVASGGEVSRNQAAEAAGVARSLAAFHLDKLVEAGLLEASFRRLGDRRGPGAGRPAKLYRRAAGEVAATLPPRAYETAAHLLAETVEQAGADLELQAAARRAGAEAGRRIRAEAPAAPGRASAASGLDPAIEQVLTARGYEPYRDGGTLRLRNCPFASLAAEFPVLACTMNLGLVEGLLEGIGDTPGRALMDPAPGRCCVAILSKDNQN